MPAVALPAVALPAVVVPDVVAYLLGAWTVDRDLVDRAAGLVGQFRGTATFRAAPPARAGGPPDVEHAERGELTWAGLVRAAERTLRLRPGPDGTARVRFADGRAFHDLDLRAGGCTAVHRCAADRYVGTFTVVSADEWRVRWDVVGPGKDQAFTSVYRRA